MITAILSKMDQFQKHCVDWKKARHTKVHTMWFHFYDNQELAKSIYGRQKSERGGDERDVVVRRTDGKGAQENFLMGKKCSLLCLKVVKIVKTHWAENLKPMQEKVKDGRLNIWLFLLSKFSLM